MIDSHAIKIAIRDRYAEAVAEYLPAALADVEKAIAELENVKANLRRAQEDLPYQRISQIEHADASLVFSAFAAVKNLAEANEDLANS
jgi:hypothetical protein